MSALVHSVLTAPAPEVSEAAAADIARRFFGIGAQASVLIGERDRNFRLTTPAGAAYLLKIVNPAEDPAVTAFQVGALRHLEERDPGLPVPRVVPALDGMMVPLLVEAGRPTRQLRLMTYLSGAPFAGVRRSAGLRRQLGAGLARLDRALSDYRPAAALTPLLWDLSHAAQLRPLIAHIEEAGRRDMAAAVLDRFEANVLPRLPSLRRQTIHNDFNPSNILVDAQGRELAGIIDFGDMVEAALVNEAAVAASYHVEAEAPLLAPLLDFVGAYHAGLPLEDEEVEVLFDLTWTRMLMTVAISAWRAALQPENRDYILRNAGRAWLGLERAKELAPGEAAGALRRHLRKA